MLIGFIMSGPLLGAVSSLKRSGLRAHIDLDFQGLNAVLDWFNAALFLLVGPKYDTMAGLCNPIFPVFSESRPFSSAKQTGAPGGCPHR